MLSRIAMLSVHTSPLAAPGERDTGGMNVFIRELCRQLGAKGIAVDIFTRLNNRTLPFEAKMAPNVNIIHIKAGPPEKIDKYEIPKYLDIFAKEVDRYRQRLNVSYDLIHTNYWLSGPVGVSLKKTWHLPLIHTYHTMGILKNMVNPNLNSPNRLERIKVEKEILQHMDAVITSNPHEKTFLSLTYGYSADNVFIIPLGVDTALFRPMPSLHAKKYIGCSAKKIVLYVGRIDPVKGIEWLIRAFKEAADEIENSRLLIVGGQYSHPASHENNYLVYLKRLASELALEQKVEFTGPKKQTALPLYYSASEVCVIPSLYESFGMVALEAMACGTPVIASNTGGLATTVANSLTGFLVQPGDSQELSCRLKQILSNKNLREKLGKQALAMVRKFNWHEAARSFIKVYNDTLTDRALAQSEQTVC
ncbi:MAG TPA: glycosyltransferase [Thermodesulfovibrionia bacterium]|nr:glycosyltransferase [Thermodesulfovibrionia bacterium]